MALGAPWESKRRPEGLEATIECEGAPRIGWRDSRWRSGTGRWWRWELCVRILEWLGDLFLYTGCLRICRDDESAQFDGMKRKYTPTTEGGPRSVTWREGLVGTWVGGFGNSERRLSVEVIGR